MDLLYSLWASHLPSTYMCSSTGKLQMCFLNQFWVFFFYLTFWPHCVPCRMLVPWPGIEPMPLQWKHEFITIGPPEMSQEVVLTLFWVMGHFGNLKEFFFLLYITTCSYAPVYTFIHVNFMEFLELLKTSPKRTRTLDVAYSCCSLVLSLKLSHQGARNEDRLMQTEITARSQRIYNGISLFIITSGFVSPSWYPETWGAESLCQILLGEVGGLGWAFYSSTEGPCCSVPVLSKDHLFTKLRYRISVLQMVLDIHDNLHFFELDFPGWSVPSMDSFFL